MKPLSVQSLHVLIVGDAVGLLLCTFVGKLLRVIDGESLGATTGALVSKIGIH